MRENNFYEVFKIKILFAFVFWKNLKRMRTQMSRHKILQLGHFVDRPLIEESLFIWGRRYKE
jgi:hypothetical protein